MFEREGKGRKRICVIGLGYIGLPTAAVLARQGHEVIGVDIRPEVVETINRGQIHIHEPGLEELVEQTVRSGNLKASRRPVHADVFFICVPTPINADKSPDLSYVRAASQAISPYIRKGNLIILESTSPPQTTETVVVPNAVPAELRVGEDVYVAYCPERVIPGRILVEVMENDRIVGGVTPSCTAVAAQLYESFVSGSVLRTSAVSAEITKLVENSYRDVNIAFANELSMMADELGADIFEVIELANRHPRVNILAPGPGVGGHCISVDPWFLVHAAPEQARLIRSAREVNDDKPEFVVQQVKQLVGHRGNLVIGCLGLAYKANVDDFRESPSLQIVHRLQKENLARVICCDPYANNEQFSDLILVSQEELIAQADLILLLTDHAEFYEIPPSALARKQVLDVRGIWRNSQAVKKLPLKRVA